MGLVPFLQMMLTHVCSNKSVLLSLWTHLVGMTSTHADWNRDEERAQQQEKERQGRCTIDQTFPLPQDNIQTPSYMRAWPCCVLCTVVWSSDRTVT